MAGKEGQVILEDLVMADMEGQIEEDLMIEEGTEKNTTTVEANPDTVDVVDISVKLKDL
jgi:hypothetical protein